MSLDIWVCFDRIERIVLWFVRKVEGTRAGRQETEGEGTTAPRKGEGVIAPVYTHDGVFRESVPSVPSSVSFYLFVIH